MVTLSVFYCLESTGSTQTAEVCALSLPQVAQELESARRLVVKAADVGLRQAAPPESPALQAWRRCWQQFQQLPRSKLRDRKVWEHTVQRDLLPQVLAWAAQAEAKYGAEGVAPVPELQLRIGRALAVRPCAHLGCTNVRGASEGRLRGRRCAGCRVTRFCCEACRDAAWPQHAAVCWLLAAEAAGVPAQSGRE